MQQKILSIFELPTTIDYEKRSELQKIGDFCTNF